VNDDEILLDADAEAAAFADHEQRFLSATERADGQRLAVEMTELVAGSLSPGGRETPGSDIDRSILELSQEIASRRPVFPRGDESPTPSPRTD
jgi:hypothetical protein